MHLQEINHLMHALAEDRPVFHSEADFQHYFAWELHEHHPDASIRLERPIPPGIHLDLNATIDGGITAIELKYATSPLTVDIAGELYELRAHGAQDQKRYDVIKDIVRIEDTVAAHGADDGFVILLTNDVGYWREAARLTTADASFRLHEGRKIAGRMAWSESASAGTTRSREAPLEVRNEYLATWRDYSTLPGRAGRFRYLVIAVQARSQ